MDLLQIEEVDTLGLFSYPLFYSADDLRIAEASQLYLRIVPHQNARLCCIAAEEHGSIDT